MQEERRRCVWEGDDDGDDGVGLCDVCGMGFWERWNDDFPVFGVGLPT